MERQLFLSPLCLEIEPSQGFISFFFLWPKLTSTQILSCEPVTLPGNNKIIKIMSEQTKEYVDAATKVALAGAAVLGAIGIVKIAFSGITIGCAVIGVTERLR